MNSRDKTFIPGTKTCSVGKKAERRYGPRFFWVLAGIPKPDKAGPCEYFVIPAKVMTTNIRRSHELWIEAPGRHGQAHKDSPIRTVTLPPGRRRNGWSIARYRERWDLIEKACRHPGAVHLPSA